MLIGAFVAEGGARGTGKARVNGDSGNRAGREIHKRAISVGRAVRIAVRLAFDGLR